MRAADRDLRAVGQCEHATRVGPGDDRDVRVGGDGLGQPVGGRARVVPTGEPRAGQQRRGADGVVVGERVAVHRERDPGARPPGVAREHREVASQVAQRQTGQDLDVELVGAVDGRGQREAHVASVARAA